MANLQLWTQERMPVDVVPIPEKKGYDSYEELFDDPKCPIDKKLRILAHIVRFETLNGLTKRDLHAMVKWLVNQNYDFVED